MHALRPVHDLRNPEIDDEARQRKRVGAAHSELPSHQREHAVERDLPRDGDVLVEAERDPGTLETRDGPLEHRVVLEVERQLGARRGLDRGPGHLAVTLDGMAVAGGEQSALDRNREIERRARDELLAVHVAAPAARRPGAVDARFRRRHPHHAEERREVELEPERPADAVRELPVDRVLGPAVR